MLQFFFIPHLFLSLSHFAPLFKLIKKRNNFFKAFVDKNHNANVMTIFKVEKDRIVEQAQAKVYMLVKQDAHAHTHIECVRGIKKFTCFIKWLQQRNILQSANNQCRRLVKAMVLTPTFCNKSPTMESAEIRAAGEIAAPENGKHCQTWRIN